MRWPASQTLQEARDLQERLRTRVLLEPLQAPPHFIAGVDAAFSENRAFGAVCLFRLPDLVLVEQQTAVRTLSFPYVPGYLSFREGPAIVAALEKLVQRPDVVLVDGQGIAHPRGLGIASFIGVLLDLPAIGCAKSRLVGEYVEPNDRKGSWSPLRYKGRTIGAVLRTRDRVRPLFMSPGHRIDLSSAMAVTLSCCGRYRIPEPLRCADMLSRSIKQ